MLILLMLMRKASSYVLLEVCYRGLAECALQELHEMVGDAVRELFLRHLGAVLVLEASLAFLQPSSTSAR